MFSPDEMEFLRTFFKDVKTIDCLISLFLGFCKINFGKEIMLLSLSLEYIVSYSWQYKPI